MPSRRANDAQVERLLVALRSRQYRQQLAQRIAAKEHIQYRSAMRRLQRYVTESQERRSYTRAPAPSRLSTREAARRVPLPPEVRSQITEIRERKPRPPPPEQGPRPSFFKELEPYEYPPDYEPPTFKRSVSLLDLQAIVAYHDGNPDEAAETLGLGPAAGALLHLATEGVDILESPRSRELVEPVREFFAEHEGAEDAEDFISLIGNLPSWQIENLFENMREGKSDFGDWLDAWHNDGMLYHVRGDEGYKELTDSSFWDLWRRMNLSGGSVSPSPN